MQLARRFSGTIMAITSHELAEQKAMKRLNPNAEDLIAEIEHDIASQVGIMRVHVRGGDYTPEVVELVSQLYRDQNWQVDASHYWMRLW